MSRPQSLQEGLPGMRRMVRYFWPYLREHRLLIVGALLALFARTGLRLLEPWPISFVIDRVLGVGRENRLGIPAIDGLGTTALLIGAAVAVVVIAVLRSLADYANTVGFAIVGNRVLNRVRNDLYRHLQGLSMSFHTKARSGDLIIRVMSDVNQLKDVAVTAVLPLLANVLIFVGMIGFMFWFHWKLALLALVTVPLFWLTTARLSRRIRGVAREQRKREGAMAADAAEAITSIKIVQALSLEGKFAESFVARGQQSQKEDVKGSRLAASLERTVDVFTAMSTALVLGYGGWLASQNELTPGDLLVFLAYLKRACTPVGDFAKYAARLAKATAAGERVLDLFDRTPEVQDLPGAVCAPAFKGAVRFENVRFGYETGVNVLDGIDMKIRPGQHVALVGPSGIGKSTLLSLLLRLYDPVQGRVLIDEHDVREFTLESLRRQVSVVLQDTLLFAATVWDNIGYGAAAATRDQIEAAARLANADDFIRALPQGYDTILGERGATLSGGQRQRIAIARAAVRNSSILVLDEPTTGLDRENERLVTDALSRLAAERTTFWSSHNLQTAARADLIVYLDSGRVVECGTHTELLCAEGRYAAMVGQAPPVEHRPREEEAHALGR